MRTSPRLQQAHHHRSAGDRPLCEDGSSRHRGLRSETATKLANGEMVVIAHRDTAEIAFTLMKLASPRMRSQRAAGRADGISFNSQCGACSVPGLGSIWMFDRTRLSPTRPSAMGALSVGHVEINATMEMDVESRPASAQIKPYTPYRKLTEASAPFFSKADRNGLGRPVEAAEEKSDRSYAGGA